ncbi:arsenical pump-driving ATPase [Propionimicrobium lymphophilum]|uniref:Arsenite-activated ATPase ArsA n=1 Tax=Propionimicrobium lymphophilum ACS-093-V-SCH5 TaxID=883161 RepID=S2WK94_9ACTN|nr:arsenical pump-driving ATPase [Propionimicrobium lymphophilum]EPD33102.1 arsenite-activated ATPase ArsA [Propionimicrobium lymphophilum ACS-093-V-SCH5]MDK7709888.1 arsenical pump-driving ATPase [Propionimicrobium lymphophilum]MDK7732863.1 arsenical pump-driving ATPase [Propionimicrobium lymphophilum]
MSLPELSTKFAFFTGKGGVGKTTVACSLATRAASEGKRVLLVSTDPASNIGQVFGREIGSGGAELTDLVPGAIGFDAVEIDPEAEAERYRESILGPVRGLLPPEVLATTEETLSGSCTVEVASFNRFVDYLTNEGITGHYDHIIFDTAPTGHTLRLLSLPGDWSSFIDKGAGDASCLGPMSGLEKNRQTYHEAVAALSDPAQTSLVLVARAQISTLQEANRSTGELLEMGIKPALLVINGILPESAATDQLSESIYAREQALLDGLATNTHLSAINSVPTVRIELNANPVMGVDGLLHLGEPDGDATSSADPTLEPGYAHSKSELHVGLSHLVDELAEGKPKLVLCMGKGGVGKTTVAQMLALELAKRGKTVHLSTTDPANHLDVSLEDRIKGLTVSSIDPDAVTASYRDEVLASKGASLDADGYAQLEEDLRSPCTEEVAVFKAFSEVVATAQNQWVVLDTAPTGHTLLLLDATGSYHRELMRQSGRDDSATTLQHLQDTEVTRPILVTLPETTPMLEAQALAADLSRAGIEPWAWVINQSLPATETSSPFLLRRANAQQEIINPIADQAGVQVVQLPVMLDHELRE